MQSESEDSWESSSEGGSESNAEDYGEGNLFHQQDNDESQDLEQDGIDSPLIQQEPVQEEEQTVEQPRETTPKKKKKISKKKKPDASSAESTPKIKKLKKRTKKAATDNGSTPKRKKKKSKGSKSELSEKKLHQPMDHRPWNSSPNVFSKNAGITEKTVPKQRVLISPATPLKDSLQGSYLLKPTTASKTGATRKYYYYNAQGPTSLESSFQLELKEALKHVRQRNKKNRKDKTRGDELTEKALLQVRLVMDKQKVETAKLKELLEQQQMEAIKLKELYDKQQQEIQQEREILEQALEQERAQSAQVAEEKKRREEMLKLAETERAKKELQLESVSKEVQELEIALEMLVKNEKAEKEQVMSEEAARLSFELTKLKEEKEKSNEKMRQELEELKVLVSRKSAELSRVEIQWKELEQEKQKAIHEKEHLEHQKAELEKRRTEVDAALEFMKKEQEKLRSSPSEDTTLVSDIKLPEASDFTFSFVPAPPPPPPPPGEGPPLLPDLPPKRCALPKVKMKGFQWKKLANSKVMNTFWVGACDIDLDTFYNDMETMFKVAATPESSNSLSNSGNISPRNNSRAIVHLVDRQKANNLSIILQPLKCTPKELREAIMAMDESRISIEIVSGLVKMAPTKDEIHKLMNYGQKNSLGFVDKFFLETCAIPRYYTRMDSWEAKLGFEIHVKELGPQIDVVSKASTQLMTSKKFAMLLELILAMGNFINGGSFRGSAYGFRMDTLLKMGDFKSTDQKRTLLHFLSTLLAGKYADVADFFTEISCVEGAAKVSVASLKGEIADLKKGLYKVVDELKYSTEPHFVTVMKDFTATAELQLQELEQSFKELNKNYDEMVKFFGQDDYCESPEEFFSIINNFNNMLEKVHEDSRREKREEERKANFSAQRKLAAKPSGQGTNEALEMLGKLRKTHHTPKE